jgi:hypothetical protein
MIIMLLSFVVFRQVYLFLTANLIGTIITVVFAYPGGLGAVQRHHFSFITSAAHGNTSG